jgi:hypothetical protein
MIINLPDDINEDFETAKEHFPDLKSLTLEDYIIHTVKSDLAIYIDEIIENS